MGLRSHRTAVVLMSGGIDSTACARLLMNKGFLVRGFYIDYGQSARREEAIAVRSIARYLRLTLMRCKVEARTFGKGEIVGRNAFFVFAGLMYSGMQDGILAMGLHAGTPYYDCSAGFIRRISTLVRDYTAGRIELVFPFQSWSKADVAAYSSDQRIPLNLTYSCEVGGRSPCGRCLSCLDRKALKC